MGEAGVEEEAGVFGQGHGVELRRAAATAGQNARIELDARPDGTARGGEASIASVGFGLAALPIGAARGWIPRDAARERTAITLRTFLDTVEGTNGFFYHFVDMETGRRKWNCELSSIDTGLFLAGVVVPCAPAGSLPFEPEACLRALRAVRERHGDAVWKRYGFADAFNPQTGWVAESVIGIDVGITLLMAENYRSERVWNWFMANPEIRRAMDLAGFIETKAKFTADDTRYLEMLARDTWQCLERLVHPGTGLPYDNDAAEGSSCRRSPVCGSTRPARRRAGPPRTSPMRKSAMPT